MQVTYLATRFLLTPLVIARAGVEAYGFWSMLFASLGVLGIQRTGLLSASVALVARHVAAGETRRATAVVRTVATVGAALGGLVALVACLGAESLVAFFGVEGALEAPAVQALRLTVVATTLALVWGGYQSYLEARQRHATVRTIEGVSQLVEALLLVALLMSTGGLLALSIAYAVRVLLPVACFVRIVRRAEPGLRLGPGSIDAHELRAIFRLGGQVQLIGVLHMAIAALPRLVIARTLGLGALGVFEAARKLVEFSTTIPAFALSPLMAGSAAVGARSDGSTVRRRVVGTATRLVACFGALPLAALWVGREAIGVLWLGELLPGFSAVIAALVPAAWLHLCTGPFTAVLRGAARPGAELAYCVLWLATLAAVMPVAAPLGLYPAALAVAATQIAVCAVLFGFSARALDVPLRGLASDLMRAAGVLLIGVWIASSATGAAPTQRLDAVVPIVAVVAITFAVGAFTGWRLVLGAADRDVLVRGLGAVAQRFGSVFPSADSALDSHYEKP